jgi:hypothetical protein
MWISEGAIFRVSLAAGRKKDIQTQITVQYQIIAIESSYIQVEFTRYDKLENKE